MNHPNKCLFVAILILLSSLCACSYSYEAMVDELNGNFSPTPKRPSIKDPYYDYSRMISREYYYIEGGYDLFLIGPEDAMNYEWELNGKIISKSKNLFYNFEEEGIPPNTENILKLTITTPRGAVCSDTAKILFLSR